MIGIELLLCYLLLFLAARADYLFRAPALDPASVKPKNPSGIDILRDSHTNGDQRARAASHGLMLEGSKQALDHMGIREHVGISK